jgi:hypothetical protein
MVCRPAGSVTGSAARTVRHDPSVLTGSTYRRPPAVSAMRAVLVTANVATR